MILCRGLECSESRIVFEDKVTVLIPSLFQLFPMMLLEKLLGEVMCVWGKLFYQGVLTLIRGPFLW